MALGLDANAKRIVEAMMKDPQRTYHIFAGHADVTRGETGPAGEKEYNIKLSELVLRLAKSKGLNVIYHKSVVANEITDPNSNVSRIKTLMGTQRKPGIGGPDLTPEAIAAYQSGMIENIQQYPSYNQLQQVTTIIPMMMSNQGGGQQKPVFIPVGGGGGGGTVIMPGPDEGQLVNSLMKTILLTNLSAS